MLQHVKINSFSITQKQVFVLAPEQFETVTVGELVAQHGQVAPSLVHSSSSANLECSAVSFQISYKVKKYVTVLGCQSVSNMIALMMTQFYLSQNDDIFR